MPTESVQVEPTKSRPQPRGPGCLLFGVLWTFATLLFLGCGIGILLNSNNEYGRFSRDGLPAQATITQLKGDDISTSGYTVDYRYTTTVNGQSTQRNATKTVPESFFLTLKVGQSIDILYELNDPDSTVIRAINRPPNPILPDVVYGFSAAVFVTGFVVYFITRRAR